MATTESHSLVLVSSANGYIIIPDPTPLRRLNYFDGKFLRASDLKAEQDYLRQLVALSNQAGGAGVAHGFDLSRGTGDTIEIGAGLAIDPSGRVLLLPQGTSLNVQELIEKSRALQQVFGKTNLLRAGEFEECELQAAPPAVDNASPNDLYLIVISPADALCGEEDVYGKLCEEACATSTDRPYAVEGLIVRAVPLVLRTPLASPKVIALTQTHLRSRVASAYFEDERRRVANLISKAGLEQETWCLGADAAAGSGVPIGLIARAGATTVFLDAWIARRERIDTPAKRYWQWRMMMRPWDVFLAQVLQFQCQLRDLYRKVPNLPGQVEDSCPGAQAALREAADTISELREFYQSTAQRFTALNVNLDEAITFKGGLSRLTTLNEKLVKVGSGLSALPVDRFLINGGIVELPSAGYLAVVPGAANTVNQQVRRLMGEGVDLRFCVVRPDYVAHALEEAQHMERISLLQGLDNPEDKPQVDILVPNGEILEQKLLSPGTGFEANVDVNQFLLLPTGTTAIRELGPQVTSFHGAARAEKLPTGGGAFYLSCENQVRLINPVFEELKNAASASILDGAIEANKPGAELTGNPAGVVIDRDVRDFTVAARAALGLWMSLRCDSNIFALSRGDSANVNAGVIVADRSAKVPLLEVQLDGRLQITQPSFTSGTTRKVAGHIENASFTFRGARFGNQAARSTIVTGLDVIATLSGNSAILVRIGSRGTELVLSADWGKEPLEVSAELIGALPGLGGATGINATRGTTLAGANLKEDANVLSDQDQTHVQALAALELIARVLNDPNFADANRRLLFPAAPKPTNELLVRGTMDWVLFHRRRNQRCQLDVIPPPPPLPPRRYGVWMGVASDAEAAQAAARALAEGKPFNPDRIFFRRVDVVEFEPGLSTLITQPQDVAEDWKLTDPGQHIVHGAIASATANESDAVAKARLARMENAVAAISDANNATTDVIATVHPELEVPGADGIIVLITLRETTPVCHLVLTSRDEDEFKRVLSVISKGEIDKINNVSELGLLGTAIFKGGTAEVVTPNSTSDPKTWAQVGSRVLAMTVITSQNDDDAVPLAQAKVIQEAIGSRVGPNGMKTPATLPAPPKITCPTFSLVLLREEEQPPACRLDARTIVFAAAPGGKSTQSFNINNDSNTDFNVTLVTTGQFAVTSPAPASGVNVPAGKSLTVAIQYTRTAGIAGEEKGTLSINTEPTAGLCPSVDLIGQPAPTSPTADLSIEKRIDPPNTTSVGPGGTATFLLTVANTGPSAASAVEVSDTIPDGTTFKSAQAKTGSGWTVTPPSGASRTVVFNKASMAVKEEAVFEVVVTVNSNITAPTITNKASVKSPTDLTPPAEASALVKVKTSTPLTPPPQPTTTCLTTFAVSSVDELRNVSRRLQIAGDDPLVQLLPALGAVNFENGTEKVTDSSLANANSNFLNKGFGGVTGALLIIPKAATSTEVAIFRKQADAIIAGFPKGSGASFKIEEIVLSQLPASIKCQGGLLIAGEPVG